MDQDPTKSRPSYNRPYTQTVSSTNPYTRDLPNQIYSFHRSFPLRNETSWIDRDPPRPRDGSYVVYGLVVLLFLAFDIRYVN